MQHGLLANGLFIPYMEVVSYDDLDLDLLSGLREPWAFVPRKHGAFV